MDINRYITFVCLLLGANYFYGQDIHFSQFSGSLLNISPGYTGMFNGDYRLSAIYRSQWQSVPVSYSTFNMNGEIRVKPKKLNKDSRLVFSLHGDGELQEGQVWEAAMYASHNKVDNLISTIDVNGQQIDGPTDKILSLGNLRTKWEAFGWEVLDMNGNDMADVVRVLDLAISKTCKGKPIMILMQTMMGNGVDFMMHTHKWHGTAPNDEQLATALGQLEETLGDY